MRRLAIAAALFLLPTIGLAATSTQTTQVPAPCGMTGANYSGTVGVSSTALIPAPPAGTTRTGIFIELLTASATLGINPTGGTASTSTAGNIVVSTGASSPNNVAYINFAAMGFVPQGAITAISDDVNRVVTAYACPK